MIPAGISVQLFSEHVTIFVLLYAVWVAVYTLVRYRKLPVIQVNFLWSSILGAYFMFSDGSYTKAATGTGYKKISFNGMTEQFISKIWYHLLINNWVFIFDHKKRKKEFPDCRDVRSILRI